MIFFSLAIFLVSAWLLPWWATAALAFVIGCARQFKWRELLQFCTGAGLSWGALAYAQDALNRGVISERVAGMMSLPSSVLVYALMFALGFVTVLFCAKSGEALRRMFRV